MALFEPAWALSAKQEGGYQNYAEDTGNYNSLNQLVGTKYGISAPVFEAWLRRIPSESDVRNMSFETATLIAKSQYWDKFKIYLVKDQYLANQIFDIIFGRPYKGAKIIQETINEITPRAVKVDGFFGPLTAAAVNNIVDLGLAKRFNDLLVDNRIASYPQNAMFLQGWINQAREYLNYQQIITTTKNYALPIIGIAVLSYAIFKDKN